MIAISCNRRVEDGECSIGYLRILQRWALPDRKVEFVRSPSGRVVDICGHVYCSIAHDQKTTVTCVSDTRVGIDVEQCSMTLPVSFQKWLHMVDPEIAPLKIWLAYEAIAKLRGEGLALNIHKIAAVPFNDDKWYCGRELYWVKYINLPSGSLLAIAVDSEFELKEIELRINI